MDRLLGKIDGNRFPQMEAVICLLLAYSLPATGPSLHEGKPLGCGAAMLSCCEEVDP